MMSAKKSQRRRNFPVAMGFDRGSLPFWGIAKFPSRPWLAACFFAAPVLAELLQAGSVPRLKQRSRQLASANDGERNLSGPEVYAGALPVSPGPHFRRRDPGNDHHMNAAVGGGGPLVWRALRYPDLHHADGAGADVRPRIGGCPVGQARPGLVQWNLPTASARIQATACGEGRLASLPERGETAYRHVEEFCDTWSVGSAATQGLWTPQ